MKQRISVDLLPPQLECFGDLVSRFLYLSGGYGSGKTFMLVVKMLQLMDANRGLPGGLLGPNTKMIKRDVIPTIKNICGDNYVQFRHNKSEGELFFPATNSTVYIFHAEDDGESIAGPNLAWGVVNEASLCSWEAFRAFVGRIRLKGAPFPQIFASGTPEEFNWVYEFFIEKAQADRRIVYANSRKNPHVASWYINMLESSYDAIARQQYVDGLYVPRTGNRFLHTFNRHRHVSDHAVRVLGAQVWAMVDFNVNPMVATIASYVPDSRVKIRIFDEIAIPSADTYLLADTLADRIGSGWKNATIFPDPAGNQRKTSAQDLITDIQILKQKGFRDIRYKNQIVLKDTYFAANNLFDKTMVAVHPKCKELIADFEQVKVKDGAFEMDKAKPNRTHALDGFKNMADYMFPVAKSYSEITSKVIR